MKNSNIYFRKKIEIGWNDFDFKCYYRNKNIDGLEILSTIVLNH